MTGAKGDPTLTEREQETLRLLFAGHDIKSIASRLGISVHTINERLREARRKLGVSSSRQAARLFAEREQPHPKLSGDIKSGVAARSERKENTEHSDQAAGKGLSLAWLGGGMLIMSSILAVVVLSSVMHNAEPARPAPATLTAAAVTTETAAADAARAWLALVDAKRWGQSWSEAGTLFKNGVSQSDWSSKIQTVRPAFGPVISRIFKTATKASSLPGAPDGDYEVIQFETNFEQKHNAVETVTLAHEASGWRVDGYFIK